MGLQNVNTRQSRRGHCSRIYNRIRNRNRSNITTITRILSLLSHQEGSTCLENIGGYDLQRLASAQSQMKITFAINNTKTPKQKYKPPL
jgi:hypothetical protein